MNMERPLQESSAERGLSPTWLAATLVGVVAGCVTLLARLLRLETAPLPFVWTDVAGVSLLAALPLAALLAASLRPAVAWCIAVALALAAGALLLGSPGWPALAASRAMLALAVALGLVLAAGALLRPHAVDERHERNSPIAAWVLAIAALVGLPWLYIAARYKSDQSRLAGLMEQTRVGEALPLARRLQALAPAAQVRGFPIAQVVSECERIVGELTARAETPLSGHATAAELLTRAQDLAVLNRTDEALDTLHAPALVGSLEAENLRGTIHEARGEFAAALASYQAVQQAAAKGSGAWLVATRGVAYCQRKLGDYAAAELAYQQLLAHDSSAATHFLLAQFYDDSQQAAAAQHHARQAMALAPQEYQAQGQQLIDRLITGNFGCWGVFTREQNR
jgi:tetratricopeptide (TPR) repeat protein